MKPDFSSVVEYVTFVGETRAEALRKMVDWVSENVVGGSGDSIYAERDADDVWRVSIIGKFRPGTTWDQFEQAMPVTDVLDLLVSMKDHLVERQLFEAAAYVRDKADRLKKDRGVKL